jgi:hypothetical protein
MASTSFRDSINSLGWSRRDADLPVNTSRQQGGGFLSSLQSLNPFGDRGYVRLPTTEGPGAPLPAPSRREEEDAWFACESNISLSRLPPPLLILSESDPHATFSCLGASFSAGPCYLLVAPAGGPAMQDMCRALHVPCLRAHTPPPTCCCGDHLFHRYRRSGSVPLLPC